MRIWNQARELSTMRKGIDFIPANIELAGLETALVNVMSREMILRQYLCSVKRAV